MSIINADAKSLEWISYLFLSQDKNGINEWLEFVDNPKLHDIHTKNQKDLGLISRLISKIFLFRCIYRGPAFAYAGDPDFSTVSKSTKYWQKVIDTFFEKYYGLNQTHIKYIQEVTTKGYHTSPFGRVHEHTQRQTSRGPEWNIPDICNHINQGCGADVMAVARVSFANRWFESGLEGKLISTVHDSIVLDAPEKNVVPATIMIHETFRDLPKNISKTFGIDWNLPLLCEVGAGPNMKDLTEVKV